MSIVITGIEKKGPVIICSTNDPKNRVYKLDFQNAKIYGITGKPIQSTCPIVDKIPGSLAADNILYAALYVFNNSGRSQNVNYYNIVESLLSYPDLLSSQIDTAMIKLLCDNHNCKLPKGYVAWCRKNDKKFSYYALQEFTAEQTFKQWPQQLVDFIKKFKDGTDFDLILATGGNKELCSALMHIINNSLKRYEIRDLFSYLRNILSLLRNNPQLRPYLDETKNAKTAHQILNDALNKKRNEKILANEAKIAALNGVAIGNIIIKIPSAMNDFTDEGEQQHNCIGYYYHETIAHGDTLIYFLRRAESPEKSYVTCRYNIHRKSTVEHRTQYNRQFDNDALFKEIDNMINNILGV